jgi:hypothetical protein
VKSIQFPFSIGIQIFDPLFAENLFFLAMRCSQELAGNISLKSKVPRISSEFLLKFNSKKFSEFLFQIYFKSEENSLRKVIPHLKLFPTIFYLQFLEQVKIPFELAKFCANLNPFEPF